MNNTMKTPQGTELPMLDLRGKPYLQVAHRLVWFREEHSSWAITTEMVEHDANHAIFRASVLRTTHPDDALLDSPVLLATATGQESKQDFPDFIEKAETKAIGRALALCGYGTQFAPDLDEGDRIVDAPTKPAVKAPIKREFSAPTEMLTEIKTLVEQKLGAKTPEAILTAINDKFKLGLTSSKGLTRPVATTLIQSLKVLPDFSE